MVNIIHKEDIQDFKPITFYGETFMEQNIYIILGISILVLIPIFVVEDEIICTYYLAKLAERYKYGIDIGCNTLIELREKLIDAIGQDVVIMDNHVLAVDGSTKYIFSIENGKVIAEYPDYSKGHLKIFKLKKAISTSVIMDKIAAKYNPEFQIEEPVTYAKAGRVFKRTAFVLVLYVLIVGSSLVWIVSNNSSKMIDLIKNSSPDEYPNYTYGKAFDTFFDETKWEFFTSDGKNNSFFDSLFDRGLEIVGLKKKNRNLFKVVKFTGKDYSDSGEIEVVVNFIIHDDGKNVSVRSVEFNGKKSENDIMRIIFDIVAKDVKSQKSTDKKEKAKKKSKKKKQKKAENNKKAKKKQEKTTTANNYYNNEFLLPYSDSTYLTDSDLRIMSSEELRIARNEIFARYGRMFNDVELQNYFSKCSWYEPLIKPENFNENQLNEYEKANIQLIKQHEKAAKSGSKSIYFAGMYTDGNGIYIDMEQYSSPGQTVYGLNAGYINILGDKIQLYENSTNIYMSEEGNLQVQVKEKSIVLTGEMTFSQTGETFDVSGEYNLQRRYPRP